MNFSKNNVVINTLAKKKILILRIILAIIFALSFINKIIAHEDFVNYIYQILAINREYCVYTTNIILGVELYLIVQLLISSEVIRLLLQVIFTLIIFSFFLIYLIFYKPNDNCFCFGNIFSLSPLYSLIKNLFIIVLIILFAKPITFRKISLISKFEFLKLCFTILLMLIFFNKPINYYETRFNEITPVQLKQLLKVENVLVIDARSRNVYELGHIPSAINYPYHYESYEKIFINGIENYSKAIVYCDSKICSLAKGLAAELMKKYKKTTIFVLNGGYEGWLSIGQLY